MTADTGTRALAPAIFTRLKSYVLGHTSLQQFTDYIHTYAPHYLDDVQSPISCS